MIAVAMPAIGTLRKPVSKGMVNGDVLFIFFEYFQMNIPFKT
jgi:hypothetical protein